MKTLNILYLFPLLAIGIAALFLTHNANKQISYSQIKNEVMDNAWCIDPYSLELMQSKPWLESITNAWLVFLDTGVCIYHAPYIMSSSDIEHDSIYKLQNIGRMYSLGMDTPYDTLAMNIISNSKSKYIARWKYITPEEDPELLSSIDRADAIIEVSFYNDGKRVGSTWLRIQVSDTGRVQMEDYRHVTEGMITLTYKPNPLKL